MNVNLLFAEVLAAQASDATSVDMYLLAEDDGFTKLLTTEVNAGNKSFDILPRLIEYIKNNY